MVASLKASVLPAAESIAVPFVKESDQKIRALTGLRFIPAMAVFISHLPHLAFISFGIYGEAYLGFNGVALFFVLSGFALTLNYYKKFAYDFKANLRPYAVSRFARIYPMHFLTFLAVFIYFIFIGIPVFDFEKIVRQLTLTQAWSQDNGVITAFNSPSWSLSVEAFLYLCFPFISFFLLKRLNSIRKLLVVGVLFSLIPVVLITYLCLSFEVYKAVALQNLVSYWIYPFPVTRLCGFIIGCVAGRIYLDSINKPVSPGERKWGKIGLWFGIVMVLVLLLVAPGRDWHFLELYRLGNCSAPFYALIIFCLARYDSGLKQVLSSKILFGLGEATLTFYLIHFYFLMLTGQDSNILSGPGLYSYMVFMFILLVALSLAIHQAIERPLARWIKNIMLKPTEGLKETQTKIFLVRGKRNSRLWAEKE